MSGKLEEVNVKTVGTFFKLLIDRCTPEELEAIADQAEKEPEFVVTDEMVNRALAANIPLPNGPDGCTQKPDYQCQGTHYLNYTQMKSLLEQALVDTRN